MDLQRKEIRGGQGKLVHRVEIEAEAKSSDDQGRTNSTSRKKWIFTVAR